MLKIFILKLSSLIIIINSIFLSSANYQISAVNVCNTLILRFLLVHYSEIAVDFNVNVELGSWGFIPYLEEKTQSM